jgi:hypothetical protein
MAFRFMLDYRKPDPRLVLVKLPWWAALYHDLGPEWACRVLQHRFCSLLDRLDDYDKHPQFEIPLGWVRPNDLKKFLGWAYWDDDDEDEEEA